MGLKKPKLNVGKRTASGIAKAMGSAKFTHTNGTLAPYARYILSVTGLTFLPSIIYLVSTVAPYNLITIYDAKGDINYSPTVKGAAYSGDGSGSGTNYKADVLPASVTSSGFTLPVESEITFYKWIAFE